MPSEHKTIYTEGMKILDFAIDIAKEAGKLILKGAEEGFEVKEKHKNDFVTNVDHQSEKLLIDLIKAEFPNHSILAEESHFQDPEQAEELAESEYTWIIDPIDGTRNFTRGIPAYCVSIAVFQNQGYESSKNFEYISGEIIAGVVHAPALRETFSAAKNLGAKFNNKEIKVSAIKDLEHSIFATGFPPQHKERNLIYFNSMLQHTGALRRMGSAALDLAYLAAGRIDGFWEFGLHPWDIAAGALIVEEAGGSVTDTNGSELDLFGADIFASNGKIHQSSVDIFQKITH